MKLLAWVGDANDTAGDPAASVSNWLASVIRFRVNNNRPADDRIFLTEDGAVIYRNLVVGLPIVVRLDVSQIPRMSVCCVWQTVLMAFGIIVASGTHSIRRRTIAVLVDMKGVLLARRETLDIGNDLHRITLLGKTHNTMAVLARRGMQDSDGLEDSRTVGGNR